jgi:uncharacterized Zn-finger protein
MASSKAASPYRCKECELAFSTRQDLEEHNRQIHQSPAAPLVLQKYKQTSVFL